MGNLRSLWRATRKTSQRAILELTDSSTTLLSTIGKKLILLRQNMSPLPLFGTNTL
ncbi:uncharacterized protein SETTUDRAFT_152488 [Exserohilum turcica Et28A]|uniref:Uncharacterized protein n=1 Tax=Exserohilum turcicum (strain 28A) TaxID=671987 RepID=R0KU94_EXST2|nr:uncharacterized protein SETTUDRAFT_152488 [Exserohilum turcica Et28A]EOA91367.1 hypothetical protein SETTUDRAFT_152488 [Exserohilum turcica Et28A]